MRQSLGLSRRDIAISLQTDPTVIAALEHGRVRDLPPWGEVVRVVTGLTAGLRIDPTPMLLALAQAIAVESGRPAPNVPHPQPQHRTVPVVSTPRKPLARGPRPGPADHDDAGDGHENGGESAASRVPRLLKRIAWIALPVLVIGLMAQSQGLRAAMEHLPRPAARLMRQVADYMMVQMAPQHEGMRWIEVADPRSRRTDRLPFKVRR